MAGKKIVCIICGKEKSGIPVKEDMVLDVIKWFKRNVTRNAQDNVLVVCKEDWLQYNKARKKFTSRMTLYIVLGVIFVIIGNVVAFSLYTLVTTLGVLLLFYLLSLLSYMPALDLDKKDISKIKKLEGKKA